MMNLYHVQDGDRPMFIAAYSWQGAVNKWKKQISAENDGEDPGEPQGVQMVAENDNSKFPEYLP